MNRRYLQLSLRKERIALEMIPPLQSSHPLREMPSGNELDPARARLPTYTTVPNCFSICFFFPLNKSHLSPSLISCSCHSIRSPLTQLTYDLSCKCIYLFITTWSSEKCTYMYSFVLRRGERHFQIETVLPRAAYILGKHCINLTTYSWGDLKINLIF